MHSASLDVQVFRAQWPEVQVKLTGQAVASTQVRATQWWRPSHCSPSSHWASLVQPATHARDPTQEQLSEMRHIWPTGHWASVLQIPGTSGMHAPQPRGVPGGAQVAPELPHSPVV